uniref:(northern house mosquito) hypothetical protein n=1 Tax=Culex pipiens TaxID=7175 RepID=A0A8D8BHP1_CULPI
MTVRGDFFQCISMSRTLAQLARTHFSTQVSPSFATAQIFPGFIFAKFTAQSHPKRDDSCGKRFPEVARTGRTSSFAERLANASEKSNSLKGFSFLVECLPSRGRKTGSLISRELDRAGLRCGSQEALPGSVSISRLSSAQP